MATVRRTLIHPLEGYRSREAGSFLAQMDDQSRLLLESLKGITDQELGWQPSPGTNTMGMLLAHLAIVEVFWTQIALRGIQLGKTETDSILGIGEDDDGMPIPENGAPPQKLNGKAPAFYEDLLSRARGYYKADATKLSDADLDREVTWTNKEGTIRTINLRWAMYHILEHFSGHYGQILLLRHLCRAAVGSPSR